MPFPLYLPQHTLRQVRTGTKILFYGVLGTSACCTGAFVAAHAYVEYLEPTPNEWNWRARCAYRAGFFNASILGQPRAAVQSFEEALRIIIGPDSATKALYLEENKFGISKVLLSIAYTKFLSGMIIEAAEDYRKTLSISQNPSTRATAALALGTISLDLGDIDEASEAFLTSIRCGQPQYKARMPLNLNVDRVMLCTCLSAAQRLAVLRSSQGQHEQALELLLDVYKTQIANNFAGCELAATTFELASIAYARHDNQVAWRWAIKTETEIADKNEHRTGDKDCLRCYIRAMNMLASLEAGRNRFDDASARLQRAITCARRVDDEELLRDCMNEWQKILVMKSEQ